MLELKQSNRLLDEGFSLTTVKSNKVANVKWTEQQAKPLSKEDFKKRYDLVNTSEVAIITGYNYLEVIDIDLKVLKTATEKSNFWDEYLNFLKDTIYDFDDKFVIYKTVNAGYHILFRSEGIEGNQKLAKLKGHKEAIIETRGKFGYVIAYEGRNTTEKTYKDVKTISKEDRTLLMNCSKFYDYKEETKPIDPIKSDFKKEGLTPWDEYNQKTQVSDLVTSDFDVVRNLSDKLIIKRHGSESPHSGYIYKDTGLMYLFSTGTIYPAETTLSPFAVYTWKNHNGDFSESSKDLYKKGFGDRLQAVEPEKIEVTIDESKLEFPIDIFPENYVEYIKLCHVTLGSYIDYMGSSLLFTMSLLIGNAFKIEVKKGWIESASVWIALVGKAGVGKTPSISNVVNPIQKIKNKQVKEYIKNEAKFQEYEALDKKEKDLSEKVYKPAKTQFLVDDVTIEGLMDMHADRPAGIGVHKDELAGWILDMNKYKAGSDLQHWLSSWSNQSISLNRKTASSSFIQKAFIPVLGGIQPDIISSFYTDENKANGFIDRLLISFPNITINNYVDDEIDQSYLDWFEDSILNMHQKIQDLTQLDEEGDIEPHIAYFSPEAKTEWIRIFNKITEQQNSDAENEYMKSMLPKQKSYIPRFALILNMLNGFYNQVDNVLEITKKSVLDAEKLSDYFINMSKKIKVDSSESNKIKKVIRDNDKSSGFTQFKKIYQANETVSKSKLAEELGVSRKTIYSYIKKLKDEKK